MVAQYVTLRNMQLIFFCIVMLVLGLKAQFTEKRVKKNPSMSVLKEESCEQLGELLKIFPPLLQAVATFQAEALTIIQGYWEADKQSWCQQASRQKMTACCERLTALHTKIEEVIAECQCTLKEMRA